MHFDRIQTVFFRTKSAIAHFFRFFLQKKNQNAVPIISDRTPLSEIYSHYPAFESFLMDQFQVKPSAQEMQQSLKHFCETILQTPAQVVFMKFQLSARSSVVPISAPDLKAWLRSTPDLVVLDVREAWERSWGSLPRSQPLDKELLEEVVRHWPKDKPLALYCHYGIRSMDAAAYLWDQGFTQVRPLGGGTEAWSLEADPSFPRYPGHPC